MPHIGSLENILTGLLLDESTNDGGSLTFKEYSVRSFMKTGAKGIALGMVLFFEIH